MADVLAPPAETAGAGRGAGAAQTPTPRPGGVLGWVVVVVAGAALAAGIAAVAATGGGPSAVEVEVPAGTSARLDAGEVVEVVEPVVLLEPGQALQIDNRDERLHVVGTLRAEAGDTTRQVFDSEGRYVMETSLRSDGLVTVIVDEGD